MAWVFMRPQSLTIEWTHFFQQAHTYTNKDTPRSLRGNYIQTTTEEFVVALVFIFFSGNKKTVTERH